MSENIHPLPAVRSPKQREHHVGLLGIYFSAEPCQARPKMGWLGCGWSSQGFTRRELGRSLQIHQVPVLQL